MNIVEISRVSIVYRMRKFDLRAVHDATLPIVEGAITALVGESGSGKTTLAAALLNCLSDPGVIDEGKILYYGDLEHPIDIVELRGDALNRFRWKEVAMVFQGAQSALNPVMTIEDQFHETISVHSKDKISKEISRSRSIECLKLVNLEPERILESFPHELSGGMKQRVMIAMALLLEPKLLILDEPTTALDVINQDFVFSILKTINHTKRISMLLLTHDIAIVSKYADYTAVMYGGHIMEYGETCSLFAKRSHPYTDGLISATPSLIKPIEEMRPIEGNPPNMMEHHPGCMFNDRCPKKMPICETNDPEQTDFGGNGSIRCWIYSRMVTK